MNVSMDKHWPILKYIANEIEAASNQARAKKEAAQGEKKPKTDDDEDENFDYQLLHHNGEQWLTFRLGKETYGLDILQVRELISYPDSITRVPKPQNPTDTILGIIFLK